MTAPAYWKFESIPLQQRVHKLSVPVRAGRRQVPPSAHSEWDTAGLQQPPAEIPADSASTGHENPHLALRAKKLDIAFEKLRAQIVWAKPADGDDRKRVRPPFRRVHPGSPNTSMR